MRPLISKHDTRYKKAILVAIPILCTIYKLAHGANILTCSEFFAIGQSIVALVLHKVVMAINLVFKKLKTWPMDDKMQVVMFDLKNWCGMPNVMGVIDGTHISITKPFHYKNSWFFNMSNLTTITFFTNIFANLTKDPKG